MSDLHFRFKDSDTAWTVREQINRDSRYLPASQGILGGGSTIELVMREFLKDKPEVRMEILAIIKAYGGKEW